MEFNINHVTISVKNIEKSTEFYKKFGFKEFKDYSNESLHIKTLSLKNMVLEMFCYKEFEQMPEHAKDLGLDLKTIGTKHFGLGVKSVEEAKEFLIQNKIVQDEIRINEGRLGKKYFFIKDPDGILVEIIEND